MATIKEEIMSIAEAQGYEGEGGSTIAEAVNALGSVMGGGGSGGSDTMVVTITQGGITDGSITYAADKTIAEIIEHIDAGGDVVALYDDSMGAKASVISYHLQTFGRNYAIFASLRATQGSAKNLISGASIYMLEISETGVKQYHGAIK